MFGLFLSDEQKFANHCAVVEAEQANRVAPLSPLEAAKAANQQFVDGRIEKARKLIAAVQLTTSWSSRFRDQQRAKGAVSEIERSLCLYELPRPESLDDIRKQLGMEVAA